METYGLGNTTDILLCIIPAFSFQDLLPNFVMLKLIPQIGSGQSWAQTSRCYNRLLETSIRADTKGQFCYHVVVSTMDFLYFACEPYDEWIRPSLELSTELSAIVAKLFSGKFAPFIKRLIPIYDL